MPVTLTLEASVKDGVIYVLTFPSTLGEAEAREHLNLADQCMCNHFEELDRSESAKLTKVRYRLRLP